MSDTRAMGRIEYPRTFGRSQGTVVLLVVLLGVALSVFLLGFISSYFLCEVVLYESPFSCGHRIVEAMKSESLFFW